MWPIQSIRGTHNGTTIPQSGPSDPECPNPDTDHVRVQGPPDHQHHSSPMQSKRTNIRHHASQHALQLSVKGFTLMDRDPTA
jgi:hypothetical protein